MLINLEKELTLNEIICENPQKVTCLYFSASWCGPCKKIYPVVEKLSKEFEEQILFIKVDVDTYEDLSEECEINAMPTFIFYRNQKQVDKFEGADEETLKLKVSLSLV